MRLARGSGRAACRTDRVRRDGAIQGPVDGAEASAVGVPYACWIQTMERTPNQPVAAAIRPDASFFDDWTPVDLPAGLPPSYRAGWGLFLRHVAEDAPFPFTLDAGVRGVQLAEAAHRSSRERRWIALEPIV